MKQSGWWQRNTGRVPSLRPPGITAPLGDVIAVALVVLFGVLPYPDEVFQARGLLLVVALLPVAVIPIRRRWPVATLGVSLACTVGIAFAGVLAPGTLIAVTVAAFSVAARTRRLVAIIYVGLAALVVFVVSSVPLHGDLFDSRALQFVSFIVVAGAMGDATRSRREYIAAVTERAERAERGKEEEARRRVAEERVRIARDLHDLVAHQISVISLSAGVASSSLQARPERAQEALTNIRSASRSVLADIGMLMALLRTENADEQRDLHPQAGLSRLDHLLSRFTDAGLQVTLHREPGIAPLSSASDHAAYLALQEGLTNAHKHGTGNQTAVDIRASAGDILLTVTNPVGREASLAAASGHGLRGLRERVAAVRGNVRTLRRDGEFRLIVTIPSADGAGR
ncbi:sensor histidine kinase [Paenarthrobacter nitroguajacolicus]|uniref:histidine kinase n=1 Tax=Paenarthrobacter nitroguajacolicus TaxID=211146 RepID=A0A558GZR2_PAENT|nr:sensor histidine kinase [Paenarthrobacter nitroguajacolicus]